MMKVRMFLTAGLFILSLVDLSMAWASPEETESIKDKLYKVYSQGYDFISGENPYLNTPQVIASFDTLKPDDAVLCYTGHYAATVGRLHDELSFIGHVLPALDKERLYVHLSDGNIAQKSLTLPENSDSNQGFRSWCFSYQGGRDSVLYDKLKKLGWLGKLDAITTINEGDFHLRHSGSGRVVAYHPEGYQQAAKAVLAVDPDYIKEIYLLDKSQMAARVLPVELKAFVENELTHIDMMNADDIVDDYYERFYGLFKHTSLAGYGATAGLFFASLYAGNVGVVNSLALASVGAFGATVIAPRYLLPKDVLEKLSPLQVPAVTLGSLGGYVFSATGSVMEYGGSLASQFGGSLSFHSQSGAMDGWKAFAAVVAIGATPQLLRFANWVSFGYLGMAGKVFFGGALFAVGTGLGMYTLLAATDLREVVTRKTDSSTSHTEVK